MRFVLPLALLGLAALPLVGPSAHAGSACDYTFIAFPAQTATAHADLASVARALGVAGVAALERPAEASSWAWSRDGEIIAVVAKPSGGFWLLPKLGGIDAMSPCGGPDVSVIQTNPTIVRVQSQDGVKDNDCAPNFIYWDHVVIDEASGQVLALRSELVRAKGRFESPTVKATKTMFTANGDTQVAIKDLAACATPAGLDAQAAAKHWVNRGRRATKAKRFDEAIAAFHHALAIDHEVAEAHSGLGYALLTRGNTGDAQRSVKHFEAALAKNKDKAFQGMVQYNLGLAAWKQAQPPTVPSAAATYLAKAEAAFAKANTLRPSEAAAGKLAEVKARISGKPAEAADGVSPAFCDAVGRWAPTPKAFASVAAFAQAIFGDEAPKDRAGICGKDDHTCDGTVWVTTTDPGHTHDVAIVGADDSVTLLEGVFDTWSGAFCPWFPEFEITHVGQYSVVTMRGESWARWEGECSEEGFVASAAVIDRGAGKLVGTFTCSDGELPSAGGLTLEADGTISFRDCKEELLTGSIVAIGACK